MISALYTRTLTRRRYVTNALGRIISEDELTFRCRVQPVTVRVDGPTGEYYRDEYVIFCAPDTDIQVNDRIVDGTGIYPEWTVKSVMVAEGMAPHHLEVRV